ncbi:MAG: hypothetical protein LBD09_07295 [Treponema sp.]|jgi:hypothetical protein|nr:hypothetical protein [Treponema sp.]
MGLLSKAATNPPELDEMGKALAARLRSLEEDGMRAVTAVSLLKAYGSFKAGFCLTLRRGFYSAWASAGMDNTAVMFPQEQLKALPGKTYYSVDYAPPRGVSPALRFWAFPLSWKKGVPVNLFMAAGEEDVFQAGAVSGVLVESGGAFLPPEKDELPAADDTEADDTEVTAAAAAPGEITETENETAAAITAPGKTAGTGLLGRIIRGNRAPAVTEAMPEGAGAVMEFLSGAREQFGPFQGCVIEAPGEPDGDFAGRVQAASALFGLSRTLASGRSLVLFGGGEDGGLIAFHLAKTVPGKAAFSFRAEKPREALSLLKPWL